MNILWALLACFVGTVVTDNSFQQRALVSECCICDDASPEPTQRCSYPGVCQNEFHKCDYCLTTKHYSNNGWAVKRGCGDASTCQANYYTTLSEPSCLQGATPRNGATCYYCCHNNNPFTPHLCRDGPDANVVTFTTTRATTTTTTPTTTTTTTTTTTPTTTTSTTTTTPTTTTTTTSTTSTTTPTPTGGQYCEVGDGTFKLQRCDDQTPMCMNTVIVTQDFTLWKKSCETEYLCNHDWLKGTSGRRACLEKNGTLLRPEDPGLVCHYCCRSVPGDRRACNEDNVPKDVQAYITNNVIDGGWSSWAPWYGCLSDCTGIQIRTRGCDNPYKSDLGRPCQGKGIQELDCDASNCKVTGPGRPTLIG